MRQGRLYLPLLIGDTIAFLVFSVMGRAEHLMEITLPGVLSTAFPFWLPWLVVAYVFRALSADAVQSLWTAVRSVLLPWLIAWPLGLLLRSLFVHRPPPLQFALVVFVTVLAVLIVWRGAYAVWYTRAKRS